MDIQHLLDDMIVTVDKLANLLEQDDPQLEDKMQCIRIIKGAIEILQNIYPDLSALMKDRPRYVAVRQLSTEWRTPQISIRGYSKLMLEGHIGSFSDEELSLIAQLQTTADQLWEWSTPQDTD